MKKTPGLMKKLGLVGATRQLREFLVSIIVAREVEEAKEIDKSYREKRVQLNKPVQESSPV